MLSDEDADEYNRLKTGLGYCKLDQTTIRMTGEDRLALLHNFCTADVKKLEPGKATEAFILNGKGKLLGHVHLLAGENDLILNTAAGQFGVLYEHLDRYIMREDVKMSDASNELTTLFVGANGKEIFEKLCGKQLGFNDVAVMEFAGSHVWIANVQLVGEGLMILVPTQVLAEFEEKITDEGFHLCSSEALHSVRVEAITPWFGIDCSNANLPQELQRDEKAISFNKGCYLGQETVARIDALGHVNQLLVGFKLSHQAATGTELVVEEKMAGKLTSVAWSPDENSWLSIGYVKRKFRQPGTVLGFESGEAIIR